MAKKVHFGNEQKARSFSAETGGKLNINKGNNEKPFTVSFSSDKNSSRCEGSVFDSGLNGGGTHWHTSEDL